jgi:YVTN family beta-propeller protein
MIAWFSFACRDNPSGPQQGTPPPSLAKAVYVLNEGAYNDANGARLSIYDIESDTVYRDVYESANSGSHLGSTGDDIRIFHGRAYVLMSHSENLVVINLSNNVMLQNRTYPGAVPHDLLIDSVRNRAYVTRLQKRSIFILNLIMLDVLDSIAVGLNPQGMVLVGGELYVCNSGYGDDHTVSVIDLNADTVKAIINVADGPTGAVVAPDGRIWVACTGRAFGTPATPGKVVIINPSSRSVVDSIPFAENLSGSIGIGSDHAFVIGGLGSLHRINLSSKIVTTNFIPGNFYALAVEAVSGDIYLTDARTFDVDGELFIFSDDGMLKKRHLVQKIPGAIAFK